MKTKIKNPSGLGGDKGCSRSECHVAVAEEDMIKALVMGNWARETIEAKRCHVERL